VTTQKGMLTVERNEARGDPGSELSRNEIISKFAGVASPVLGVNPALELARGLLEEDTDIPLSLLRKCVLPVLRHSTRGPWRNNVC